MITASLRYSYLRLLSPLVRIPKPNHLFSSAQHPNSQNQTDHLQELIHDHIRLGRPELAVSAYQTIDRPTIFLQNSTIRCLSDHGYFTELLDFYAWLQRSPCNRSDNYTFPFVIKACAVLFIIREGKEVHCRVLRTGYGGNVVIQTALLNMYAKNGCLEYANKVFDEITNRDSISWNALLCGYSSHGYVSEAFEVFQQMMVAGLKPTSSTFLSLIPLCACVGASGIGLSLHGFTVKCGAVDDEALVPTLISMYAGFEELLAARMLFEMLQTKDVIAWNSMISAYARHEESDEALKLFKLMFRADTWPNSITFVSILPAYGKLASNRCGESVHAAAIKLGQAAKAPVITGLLSMYSKLGELNAAEYLFNLISEKNLLLWNCMISAYLVNGHWYMALDIFRKMQLEGVTSDAISMVSVISACNMSRDLLSGKAVHAYSLRNGFASNVNAMNALLSLYSDHDQFSASHKLFNEMPIRNVITWNTLISGWAKIGDTRAAVASFHQMVQQGVKYDIVTMISILPTFNRTEDLRQGMFFHALGIKNGYDSDTSVTNALISMYTNCSDVGAGDLLFDNLSIKSVVTWNALMTGYRNHSLDDKIMVLFDQMKLAGQKPNSVTLLNILPICKSQLQGKSIHAYAVKNFAALESQILTSTICMYAKFENFDYCHLLFDTVDKRNVVSWNTMISVYTQNKHVQDAFACFMEMLRMGVQPDSVTILMIVSATCQLDRLDMAQCIMAFILRRGFKKNISIVNALIDMYARCGSISTAKELFDGLNKKDSITWSAMINGFGIHGDAEAALKLFTEMQDAGVEPDDVTFVSILSACSHAGLVEQGRMLFNSMSHDHRIEPRMEHYACMVDLLGRTGHLEEAYDLVNTVVTFRHSSSLLESLLGACRWHGNTRVGEAVAKLLLESKKACSSSSYVMLSNIYAAEGRWCDSRTVRSEMDLKGLRKDPGVSFIMVN